MSGGSEVQRRLARLADGHVEAVTFGCGSVRMAVRFARSLSHVGGRCSPLWVCVELSVNCTLPPIDLRPRHRLQAGQLLTSIRARPCSAGCPASARAARFAQELERLTAEESSEEALKTGLAQLESVEPKRCAGFATTAIAGGLAERQVRLAERQGELILAMFAAALCRGSSIGGVRSCLQSDSRRSGQGSLRLSPLSKQQQSRSPRSHPPWRLGCHLAPERPLR